MERGVHSSALEPNSKIKFGKYTHHQTKIRVLLGLSDFVSCSKLFYIWGVYITALEHCGKRKFRIQLHLTVINKILRILACLNGFVTCRDVHISGTEHNWKWKFSMQTHLHI